MNPTIRQLEYFVAIADHGSFQAAAKACFVTQPGLSAQLAQLESTLDVRLFERDRRSVLITEGGALLLQRARGILSEVAHLVEAAGLHAGPLSGRLRLGVIPTIAPYLLPEVLPRVRRTFERLQLELHEGQTAELVAQLDRGELDLLLVALEAELGRVETAPLFEDRFLLAAPQTSRFAKRKRVSESDLVEETVLFLEDGHCLRDQALGFCNRAGAAEATDFRAGSLPTLVQMVAGGSGITLLPELARSVEGRAGDLAFVPFQRLAPFRTIGLAWRSTSPRGEEFRELGKYLVPEATRRPSK